ncbi:hypothetical protein [Pinibacter soli]|uniref:Uncharacterized protein n=1 Tax=Pinibacter soli TaxID=3044211 RepID=A0ABT6R868_9BACT|nr:hypothetical protein [Pinibacter soli]MDI3318760.1 hypothetical protein [Pinibacter soli]
MAKISVTNYPVFGEKVYYEVNNAVVLDESKPALDPLAEIKASNPW